MYARGALRPDMMRKRRRRSRRSVLFPRAQARGCASFGYYGGSLAPWSVSNYVIFYLIFWVSGGDYLYQLRS